MKIDEVVSFVLPGQWWTLDPTGSETQLLTTVRKHVDRAVGGADDRATLRRELRTQLLEAARSARAAGADRLYLASQLADGVPFPATLLVVRAPARQRTDGSLADRTAALFEALPAEPAPQAMEWATYPLVRVTERTARTDARIENVQARYWLAVPETGELIMFAFSCPLVTLADQVVDLFDAIMTTVAFPVAHAAARR